MTNKNAPEQARADQAVSEDEAVSDLPTEDDVAGGQSVEEEEEELQM